MDVNFLRRVARNGLDDGNFILLDLSLGFWANGGHAEAVPSGVLPVLGDNVAGGRSGR
ncbi:hypothetical protein [Arthrobacter sp. U41]|uniref:hypothetical protein n=1 Tax=Arthrobacter sp. U41 TaxID=1849032 RepID=UPI0012FAD696|nr:hypothetical protein [Arthrobacter sp. U41]